MKHRRRVATVLIAWFVGSSCGAGLPNAHGDELPLHLRRVTSSPCDERRPCFSPDGGSLVYQQSGADGWDLWVADLHTWRCRRLLPASDHVAGVEDRCFPSWSPNGKLVAFASKLRGGWQLFTADVATGAVMPLTKTGPQRWLPVWSPDGSRLACIADHGHGSRCVQILDLNGAVLQELTPPEGWVSEITWLSGALVCSVAHRSNGGIRWGLEAAVLERDGTARWSAFPASASGQQISPTSARDGRLLLFAGSGQGNWDIWAVPPYPRAPAQPEPLTTHSAQDRDPTLSADGTRFAFSSNRAGSYDIWLADVPPHLFSPAVIDAALEAYAAPGGAQHPPVPPVATIQLELRTISLPSGDSAVVIDDIPEGTSASTLIAAVADGYPAVRTILLPCPIGMLLDGDAALWRGVDVNCGMSPDAEDKFATFAAALRQAGYRVCWRVAPLAPVDTPGEISNWLFDRPSFWDVAADGSASPSRADILLPEVQEQVLAGIAHWPVGTGDGFMLDLSNATAVKLAPTLGWDAETAAAFKDATGRDAFALPVDDPAWWSFRLQRLTEFTGRCKAGVRESIRRGAIVLLPGK